MNRMPTVAIAALGLASIAFDAHAATKYRVTCLDCTYAGGGLRPVKINNSGAVAANDRATGQGYVVSGGTFTPTPLVAGAAFSTASDINDAGHVVGTQNTATEPLSGYLWCPGAITLIPGLLGWPAIPGAINAVDQVTGSSLSKPFLYENGVTTALPLPPSHSFGWGYGINAAGHVAGYALTGGTYADPDGWVYADGTLRVLSRRFVSTEADAINDLDQTAGRVDVYAAFWDASGKLKFLNTMKGFSAGWSQALNIHGVVVGYLIANNSSGYPVIAFLWDGTRLHDMNDLIEGGTATGWMLQEADSINDSGTIVGIGLLNGQTRAFMATPVSR